MATGPWLAASGQTRCEVGAVAQAVVARCPRGAPSLQVSDRCKSQRDRPSFPPPFSESSDSLFSRFVSHVLCTSLLDHIRISKLVLEVLKCHFVSSVLKRH